VRRRYVFDPPDRFVAGTIGQPGNRTFFLQARDGRRVVSVVLEKVQVAVLADRLGRLLEEVERRGLAELPQAANPVDTEPLDEPLVEAFRAGTLTLGWDESVSRVLVEARESEEDDDAEEEESEEGVLGLDDDSEDGPDFLRVRLTPAAARSFVERALQVVAAGRPPCPLCGAPLEATGHICPRRNGHYVN
jgi:uncharacterized repeat protein (TIGR03847 family)